jgi:mitochondrial import receptor subunit TOM20
VLATLDPDLISSGTHCAQCLRVIIPGMSLHPEGDQLSSSFCSRECQTAAYSKYGKLLFSLEPPIPELAPEITADMMRRRKKSQEAFVQFLQQHVVRFQSCTYLTAQFIANYIIDGLISKGPFSTESVNDYALSDHLERIRYLELSNLEEQHKLVYGIFENIMPGLQQFLSLQRFSSLVGKMAYNAFGVCFSGGRNDKVRYSQFYGK